MYVAHVNKVGGFVFFVTGFILAELNVHTGPWVINASSQITCYV